MLADRWSFFEGVRARRLIDAVVVLLVLAIYLEWADPDLLRDGIWVTLAVGAFVLGFRATIIRIAIVVILGYAYAASLAPNDGLATEFDPFELTEAPLVVIISVIVALMADGVSGAARRYARLYRHASERLSTAHEDERARLARDLHDGVGQTLTAALLTLDSAGTLLKPAPGISSAASSTEDARVAVMRARDLVGAALEEAGDVAAQLRPVRIREIGLGAALTTMAASAGVQVDIRFQPGSLPAGMLEPQREIQAYRIVQEAIGNAARHSHAGHIWIEARVDANVIEIQVGDDGVGFDTPAVPIGLGLEVMEERAAIIGGRLDVRSDRGAGTTVTLAIPLAGQSLPSEGAGTMHGAESVV